MYFTIRITVEFCVYDKAASCDGIQVLPVTVVMAQYETASN